MYQNIKFRNIKGLTLVELLVATGLSLVLLLSGVSFYGQIKAKIPVIRDAKLVQQRARIALDVLTRLTAGAGLVYCQDETDDNYYVPMTVGADNDIVIQSPIPDWEGLKYSEFRYGKGFSNVLDEHVSTCGEAEIKYKVANYAFKLDNGKLNIKGFGVKQNSTAIFHSLMHGVSSFKYEFGVAKNSEDNSIDKYVNKITGDGRMVRSVKYTITVVDPNSNNKFTLTKVVRLHNPIIIKEG